MALLGHAAAVLNGSVVVVRVDLAPLASVALSVAALVVPVEITAAWSGSDAGLGRLAAAVVVVVGCLAAAGGVVRARLFVGARCVDTVRWSFRAPRMLAVALDGRSIGARVSGGGDRRVAFTVDGAAFADEEIAN